MKKVLIITYYFPPAGGPGSQRVVKFAKYLLQYSWQPVILTVENGEFPYVDDSLNDDITPGIKIYRTKSWTPFLFYKKITGRKADETLPVGLLTHEKRSLKERMAAWIRANMFIPDARLGWIPYAVQRGLDIIHKEKIDLIFTSSPPHSLQLSGFLLRRKTGVPWVADLRDPWTGIRYYKSLKRVTMVQKFDAFLEKQVLKNADQITTVSRALSHEFEKQLPSSDIKKFHVLPNGYDEQDFDNISVKKTNHFKIVHTGNLLAHQNPIVLWKSLVQLLQSCPNLKNFLQIHFIGRIQNNIINSVKHDKLDKFVRVQNFIPHQKVLNKIKNASVLLMVVPDIENNEGIVTSKIFEYIGSGRPILVVGPPDGDAGKIISSFSQSAVCDYDDIETCSNFLKQIFDHWKNTNIPSSELALRKPFSREVLTKKLVSIFNLNY